MFDNVQLHKEEKVYKLLQKLNITPIYNVPYCPQFNGIESYFSALKASYNKLLARDIMDNNIVDQVKLIQKAIEGIDEKKVKKCADYGFNQIKK